MMKTVLRLKKIWTVVFMICSSVMANAQNIGFSWAVTMGSDITDYARGVVADASGNVYVTGNIQGPTDFDPGPGTAILPHAGGNDMFLAKYDPNGNYLWAQTIGGKGNESGSSIAIDGNGNLYITGSFSDTVDFDPGTGTALLTTLGSNDVFLAKYDTSGKYLWAKGMGGSESDIGFEVALDKAGNIYVTGYFSGTAYFDPGNLTTTLVSAGNRDVFLAKYDFNGNYLWAVKAGGGFSDEGWGVAVDSFGNAYVTGYLSTSIAPTGRDAFLTKYDANGNNAWTKNIGGTAQDHGSAVATDASGNIIVTGLFRSATATFAPGVQLSTAGSGDIFVAKYDSSGNNLWANGYGGTGLESGNGVSVDALNNVYVVGHFQASTINFNPGGSGGTLTSVAGRVFIAKFDSSGSYVWVGDVDGSEPKVKVYPTSGIYIYGGFLGGDLDPGPDSVGFSSVPAANGAISYDAFVVKLGCWDTTESSTIQTSIECGDEYYLNGGTYDSTGIYTLYILNKAGCYNTLMLDLTVLPVPQPDITIDSFTLGVTGTYNAYQWFKNGEPIPGATDSTYTVTENANYSVTVTSEYGCEVTSNNYLVNNVPASSIDDIKSLAAKIAVYPNPAEDVIYIESPVAVHIQLTSIEGRRIKTADHAETLNITDVPKGIYLLNITGENGVLLKVEKVVKQ